MSSPFLLRDAIRAILKPRKFASARPPPKFQPPNRPSLDKTCVGPKNLPSTVAKKEGGKKAIKNKTRAEGPPLGFSYTLCACFATRNQKLTETIKFINWPFSSAPVSRRRNSHSLFPHQEKPIEQQAIVNGDLTTGHPSDVASIYRQINREPSRRQYIIKRTIK